MAIVKVGVMRGGPSREYDISLKSGQHVLNMLNSEPLSQMYKGVDILVDKEGVWHIEGLPQTPEQALRKVDVVFNTMRGDFGGDGKLQRILETLAVPFVGSKSYASALAQNKGLSKQHFKKHGIKTPYYKELNLHVGDDINPVASELFRSFPMPVVVKPKGLGSSIGVSYASNMDQLIKALAHAREYSSEILVEEYITGKEIISGFIEDFRGKDLYHLFPVEVKKKLSVPEEDRATENVTVDDLSPSEKELLHRQNVKAGIFDFGAKHSGDFDHQSPAHLSEAEKTQIYEAIEKAKSALDLRHFATADFIVHPRRGVYLLEINSYPGIHEHAPFLHSLDAGGIKHHEFLHHLIRLALGGEK